MSDVTYIPPGLYSNLIKIPYSVITASIVIIFVTTGVNNSNGVSALIGGYSGLLLGILFFIILNLPFKKYLNLVPFLSIIVVCATMISYLSIYYDKLANDQVADYYNMFSQLCTLFLVIQLGIIFTYCHKSINEKCMSNTTIAVLNVLGLIQFLFVITIGIVLKFYSTQG